MQEPPGQPVSSIIPASQPQELDHLADEHLAGEHLVVEAEWVRRYPSRRRWNIYAWIALVLKVTAACALAWLFIILPAGSLPTPIQTWKTPVIICALVCFIGKTLLDTLFYDHYQP